MLKIFPPNQKGSTLLISILVLAIVIAASLSLATLQVAEVKRSGLMGRSVQAYYTAEEGLEANIRAVLQDSNHPSDADYQDAAAKNAQYRASIHETENSSRGGFLEQDQTAELSIINHDATITNVVINSHYTGVLAPDGQFLEVTIIRWPQSGLFNGAAIKNEEHLYPVNVTDLTFDVAGGTQNYRFRIKPYCPKGCPDGVVTYTFQTKGLGPLGSGITDHPLPDQAVIQSTGRYGKVKRAVTTEMVIYPQAMDIFNYVLFSNDDIKK